MLSFKLFKLKINENPIINKEKTQDQKRALKQGFSQKPMPKNVESVKSCWEELDRNTTCLQEIPQN